MQRWFSWEVYPPAIFGRETPTKAFYKRPIDGETDEQTDKPSYRVYFTNSKSWTKKFFLNRHANFYDFIS